MQLDCFLFGAVKVAGVGVAVKVGDSPNQDAIQLNSLNPLNRLNPLTT